MAAAIRPACSRGTPVSQPSYPPVAGPQGSAPPPAPAAPTQVVFPGQVQLPPQPQYAPTPVQQQPAQFATGFPTYVSPPPSPKNRTGLLVGILVCVVVAALAVLGFVLVG
jgi:hypothetical protein